MNMIKFGADYSKLKKNLKLASARLKLLQLKKSEQNEKLKLEIGDYLKNGKYVQAKMKAQKIITETKSVEALELIKLYCDELLEKYELFEQRKQPDITLKRPISSLIWVAPYYQTHVTELQVIAKQLSIKYGSHFNKTVLKNSEETVDPELIKRVIVPIPLDATTEKCLQNISLKYGITYKKNEECVKDNFQDVKKCGCEISAALNREKDHFKLCSKDEVFVGNAVKKCWCETSAALNQEREHSEISSKGGVLAENAVKKCWCEVSAPLNQEKEHSKLSSKDEVLLENAGKKADKISKKKSFRNMFKSKNSKRSKQHPDETISSENGIKKDNVSGSLDFQVQENQQVDQNRSSLAPQENKNKGLKCDFSLNNGNDSKNGAINNVSENYNGQQSFNDENIKENSFTPTAPPSSIPVYQPITAYQPMYEQPPPSYESLYFNNIGLTDPDQNLAQWFDLVKLPRRPAGNPDFNSSVEDTSEEMKKKR